MPPLEWRPVPMTRHTLSVALLAIAVLAQTPLARAESEAPPSHWCYDKATNDQRIEGCSAVLAAGSEDDGVLAVAYYRRGNAYSNMRQRQRAIADYDAAIQLKPTYVAAIHSRANQYRDLGQ